ncbi:MFS transporter [Dactylosporangium sp. NPDC051485]|uniref:MFS transporter n=1 Tax=Dactylosporangium sp. NPDC051485 TaxID=3154846 RepID=UPI00343E8D4D
MDPSIAAPVASPRPADPAASRRAVAVLAVMAFLVVTGETTPVGLIREIAVGLHTTDDQVGLAIGGYALIAGLSSVPLAHWTARVDRRPVLLTSLLVFAAGHLAAAAAGHVAVFTAARAVAALGHGLLFAVAVPTAIRLADPGAQGKAGARVMVGSATALVAGTPLATYLGQLVGWRTALAVIAATALLLAGAATRLLPAVPGHERLQAGPGLFAVVRRPGLATVLAATLTVSAAHFVAFTFLAPYVAGRLHVRDTGLAVLLLGYGAAAVAASSVAGRFVDRRPRAGTAAAVAAFTLALIGIWLTPTLPQPTLRTAIGVVFVVAWGASFAALAVLTSLIALRHGAKAHTETVNAVSGIAFQVGVVAGSALGSLTVAAGHLNSLPLLAAGGGVIVSVAVWVGGHAFEPTASTSPTRGPQPS